MYRMNDEQRGKLEKVLDTSFLDFKQEMDLEEAMDSISKVIEVCGDDPTRDGLEETPFRVVKAYLEYTKGYREDPKQHLTKEFEVEHDDIVLIKDIDFNSLCEHHFAPFYGKVHIAYIPSKSVAGLSKFARVVDGYAQRFQVQERLTQQIADAIDEVLQPKAVAVVIEAAHYCMCGRGIKKKDATTTTSTMRGLFRENMSARMEILDLMKR